jgi:hypothetical protein
LIEIKAASQSAMYLATVIFSSQFSMFRQSILSDQPREGSQDKPIKLATLQKRIALAFMGYSYPDHLGG